MVVFQVSGYSPAIVGGVQASCSSFKLDLRIACKQSRLYFQEVGGAYNIKNVGCVLFGQPDVWRGVGKFIPTNFESPCSIEISIDAYRAEAAWVDTSTLVELLEQGLETLKREGIIKSFHPA